MKKEKEKKDIPLVEMPEEEREQAWDELYEKEEGVILEFNAESNSGKIKSLQDGNIYKINCRELVRTKLELRPGDKVLFAPFEDTDGNGYARIIRLVF